jgi:hypothetical protein
MMPMTTAGTCSGLPVLRYCTADSKAEGEQRLRASLSDASSSGANGFGVAKNGLALPGLGGTASGIMGLF